MAIDMTNTVSMMQAMERVKPPASFLVDTFFSQTPTPATTDKIAVEYRKGQRRLAPFVVSGAGGVNVARTGSKIDVYKPPMMGPRRVLAPEDIETRSFGENIYSSMTPAERATIQQARDLKELQDMIMNRKNKMAADILRTGKCQIKGYADDGTQELIDEISFDGWTQKVTPTTLWDSTSAKIYGDVEDMSEQIRENAGQVPDVAVCGKNIRNYIMRNDEMMKWLAIPNAANLSLMSLQPRIVSPQVVRLGFIQALNLELFAYLESYIDDDGTQQSFIGDDDFIMGISGRGRQLHGAVTLVENKTFQTYAASYVPKYVADENSNTLSLAMFSRCVLAPETVDDWGIIKTKG